jgi:hypothetical protein
MIVLRREVGDVLRGHRQAQGRTLREISASAAVSLGYLSEVSDRAAESEAISALLTLPVARRSDTLVRASAA